MLPADFHFLRPAWFIALLPLALLLVLLARGGLARSNWEAVCDRHLLPFILMGRAVAGRRRSLALIAAAGVLALTALAGPAWERLPQPVFRDQSAFVIALDLSRSMDATDIEPSRLSRARFKITDLLSQRESGQTALVVYANQAFVVVPLTDDRNAIELYLQSLTTDLLPAQGSRPDRALQEAGALLLQAGVPAGDILMVTDYADARAAAEARHLAGRNYRVSVLGVGTDSGAPVPLESGDFLTHGGEIVVPALAGDALRALAQAGGGIYRRLGLAGSADVSDLAAWAKTSPAAKAEDSEKAATEVWRERGPWLLLLLAPLAALAFRRGVLAVAAALLLPLPQTGYAQDWLDAWLRPDQQAARALSHGDAARAARLFEDARWKAAAQYRNGDFADAAKTLEPLAGAGDWYNRGNALAQSGDLQQAVAAYRRALELEPDNDDAQHNLNLVEQVMQQMQQQMQQGGEGEQQQAQQQEGDGEDQARRAQQRQAGAEADESDSGDNQDAAGDSDEAQGDSSDTAGADDSATQAMTEDEQAIEQYLRRISDDPRRLLQRKLHHLNRRKERASGERGGESPW